MLAALRLGFGHVFFQDTSCLQVGCLCQGRGCSACVDQGIEKGFGLLIDLDMSKLLPSWHWAEEERNVQADGGGGDGSWTDGRDVFRDLQRLFPPEYAGHLFPHAVVIPGTMHILNNLSSQFMDELKSWKQVQTQLSAFCRSFRRKDQLKRLKFTCLSSNEPLFCAVFPQCAPELCTWRWGSIMSVLNIVLRWEAALRTHWDLKLYMQGSQDYEVIDARVNERETYQSKDPRCFYFFGFLICFCFYIYIYIFYVLFVLFILF